MRRILRSRRAPLLAPARRRTVTITNKWGRVREHRPRGTGPNELSPGARCWRVASYARVWLGSRRAVVDGSLRGRIDLFRC